VGELKFPNNFTVDCGDFFGLGGEQDSLKSTFMVHAMDELGYDVVTLGEREFNFGQQFLLAQFKTSKMDVVCANLVYTDSKKPFVKPYVIRKVGTLKVAFFGLMGKDMKIRPFKGDPGLTILDPTETAKALLPELRKKADVVVLLSHLGMSESQKLTVDAPVDVMVFGHQPGLFRTLAKTQDVITVRGGERGQYIPEVHLVVEDKKITSFDGDVVQLDDKVPADEAMNTEVDKYQDALNQRFAKANEATAQTATARTAQQIAGEKYLGENNCRRCHEAEYQKWSTQAHAHAFQTLVTNQRDSTPECLPCHVVGMGSSGGFISKQSTPDLVNVQCESCHGMGTRHGMTDNTVGPEVCQTCHTQQQSPNFQYDEMVQKIVHWE
jgi:2',3'-cyclic-nucleotide 2'-phosphodiesterase (5'-nucleotidase family)